MSAVPDEEDKFERRAHPRTKAECPVHYLSKDGGSWNNATLEDYSAGGLCFHSGETLVEDTKITIQITRDAHPAVPPMAASAIVVRCELEDGTRFKVACKLTRVRNEDMKPHHYLRR
jgi:hypothetical protein